MGRARWTSALRAPKPKQKRDWALNTSESFFRSLNLSGWFLGPYPFRGTYQQHQVVPRKSTAINQTYLVTTLFIPPRPGQPVEQFAEQVAYQSPSSPSIAFQEFLLLFTSIGHFHAAITEPAR